MFSEKKLCRDGVEKIKEQTEIKAEAGADGGCSGRYLEACVVLEKIRFGHGGVGGRECYE